MENYTRVRQPRSEGKPEDNEVRITAAGKARAYISFAYSLLEEKGHSTIVLRAMGKAINKAVAITEIIKRRVAGLHQLITLSSTDITDIWEPKEEGLDRIETVRHVSVITIHLSKGDLDTSAPGYQPPLPADQVTPLQDEAMLAGEADTEGVEGDAPRPRNPRRFRGRGRGRGRGRARGRGRSENPTANGDEAAVAEGT